MNGHDFIRLAGKLVATQDPDEASVRTAVSRAYYGAYHLTVAFLKEIGFHASGHGEPVQFLGMGDHPHARHAGKLLADLQNARIKADYQLERAESRYVGFARQKVEAAHQFVALLDHCRQSEVRYLINSGITAQLARRRGTS